MDDATLALSIKKGFEHAEDEDLLKMLGIARLDAVFAYRFGVFLGVLDRNPDLRSQMERVFGLKLSVEPLSTYKKATRPIHDTAEVSELELDSTLPPQYFRA